MSMYINRFVLLRGPWNDEATVKIVLELNENVKVLTSAVHASLKESSVVEFEVPEEIKFPLDSEADLNDAEELLLSNSSLHFKLVSCVVTGLSKLFDMLY